MAARLDERLVSSKAPVSGSCLAGRKVRSLAKMTALRWEPEMAFPWVPAKASHSG